jgi:cytochrome oxidase assembly protein ShyY1
LLLEAYGYGMFGQIALIASIVSFVLAAAMLILTVLGLWHLRRVSPDAQIWPRPGSA